MKKLVSLLLVAALGAACCLSMTACKKEEIDLTQKVNEAQGMTTEQLLEKAKTESGTFYAYGNTSRISTAMENFVKAYGSELGLTTKTAVGQKKDDSAIYTELNNEKNNPAGAKNASMVLIQDSAQLQLYRQNTDLLTNYIPNGMEDKVDQKNRLPLAHQFINKLFIYNKSGATNLKFDNVWALTEEGYKGKIFFKSPTNEQVNKNFLIMLTNDEWSGKLEAAYKKMPGKANGADDVGTGKKYKNYGYKWVAEFLANCSFAINSDTTIAQDLSKSTNHDKMGLFVLSKFRDSSVVTSNLQVSAWDKKDGSNDFVTIEPFAGFMYSIYAQVATYGPRPYTAMLFINYLMTEAGFEPWKSLGGYSANNDIPIYTGNNADALTLKYDYDKDGVDEEYVVYKDNNGDYLLKTHTTKVDGKDKVVYTYINYNKETNTVTSIVKDGENDKTIIEGNKVTLTTPKTDANGDPVTQETLKLTAEKSKTSNSISDQPLSFWNQTLVIEDGDYINQAKQTDISAWIDQQVANNK